MIVCGLIGMSTKFVECTLGVKYQMPFITTTMNILFGTKYVYMARLAGIVTGLAWTRVGGDILFIESTRAQGT
jgi:ATP-dependent Lon protease